MKLKIDNLSVVYPNGTQALKNIKLDISNGMFGLLGPNGAGKSTLMRIIATLQQPTSGEVFFNGLNVIKQKNEIRKVLGYLPQEFGVYPKISAEKMLNHLAILKGIVKKGERKALVDSLLIKTNLYDQRKKNMGGYSGGMKQRFGIAQALLNNPKLIIVDEPTAGLDPAERNRFLNLLSELGENTIVILSTHIVDDAKELCADMAILNQGKILYKGNPQHAIEEIRDQIWEKTIEKQELKHYKQTHQLISEKMLGGKPLIHIYAESNPNNDFMPVSPDLEDVYFKKIMEADKSTVFHESV